jgi:hypothetical protein
LQSGLRGPDSGAKSLILRKSRLARRLHWEPLAMTRFDRTWEPLVVLLLAIVVGIGTMC